MGVPESLRFTYEDYLLTPDDRRYELVDGDLLLTPAPSPYHQTVGLNLGYLLKGFVDARGLGRVFLAPCDVVLSRYDVVQPDVFFIRTERLSIIGERNIQGEPDLVIQVLSPSTESRDREVKAKLYLCSAVSELWIVDPVARAVELLSNEGVRWRRDTRQSPDVLESAILPGLEIPLARVF